MLRYMGRDGVFHDSSLEITLPSILAVKKAPQRLSPAVNKSAAPTPTTR
jgi:hypothetical protein